METGLRGRDGRSEIECGDEFPIIQVLINTTLTSSMSVSSLSSCWKKREFTQCPCQSPSRLEFLAVMLWSICPSRNGECRAEDGISECECQSHALVIYACIVNLCLAA